MVFYGEYKLETIYDINDFNANSLNKVFKVTQLIGGQRKASVKRYCVITELNFLLFDPVPNVGYKGKLLFAEDLRKAATAWEFEDNYLSFKWRKGSELYLEFCLDGQSVENFQIKEWLSKRSEKLLRSFKLFQEDSFKLSEDISNKLSVMTIEELDKRIKYNEQLLVKDENNKVVNQELLTLYQKAVEILSSQDNADFSDYLDKLQALIKKTHNIEENYSQDILKTMEDIEVEKVEETEALSDEEKGDI